MVQNKKIIVRWRISQNEEDLVKGITLLRSAKSDGVYENLTTRPLSPDTRTFTDTRPGLSNYYKILLTGKENITSSSFPYFVQTEDNDPPAPPQMLSGSVDSLGIVTIVWKENTEKDLLGYNVFRSNNPQEEFISLGHDLTSKNICRDTISLNTLTQNIYYQVVAVDKRYNSSDYSAILQLSRPDTISPAPAVITRIDIINGKAILHLENSPSNDVVQYELYRMGGNDTTSEILKFWNGNLPATYDDIPEEPEKNYYYEIKTFDLAGNRSKYDRLIYLPNTEKKKVTLRAEPSENGRSILLAWDIPEGIKPIKTILYRGTDSVPISIHFTLEGARQTFADNDIEINTDYRYLVKVFDENGKTFATSGYVSISTLSGSDSETN